MFIKNYRNVIRKNCACSGYCVVIHQLRQLRIIDIFNRSFVWNSHTRLQMYDLILANFYGLFRSISATTNRFFYLYNLLGVLHFLLPAVLNLWRSYRCTGRSLDRFPSCSNHTNGPLWFLYITATTAQPATTENSNYICFAVQSLNFSISFYLVFMVNIIL